MPGNTKSTTISETMQRSSSIILPKLEKQRDLKEKQSQLGLPEHKLIGAVSTRWNSTYNMVKRILEQQQALSAVLLEDRKSWCLMLSDADVTVLEKLVELLKHLSYLTDAALDILF